MLQDRWQKRTRESQIEGPAVSKQVMAHVRLKPLNRTDGLVNGLDQWPIFEAMQCKCDQCKYASFNIGYSEKVYEAFTQ